MDDGVFDSGLLARNGLRVPATSLLGRFNRALSDQLSPYVFTDAGYAKNEYTHADASPIGAGIGADYQFGSHLNGNLTTAWALKREGLTQAGQFRLESRIALTF